MTVESKAVMPLVTVGKDTLATLDVREFIATLIVGQKISYEQFLAWAAEQVSLESKQVNLQGPDWLNFLEAVCYFAWIDFGRSDARPIAQVDLSSDKPEWGYIFRGSYDPRDLVQVERTTGPNAGRGGTFIIPRDRQETEYPSSDGWTVVREFLNVLS